MVLGVTPYLLYSMIPNHLREHSQSSLSRTDLVHSQYSRLECPTRPRRRFHACVRPSTSNSLAVIFFRTFAHTSTRPLSDHAVSPALSFFLFPSFALLGRRPDVTPGPVKLFNNLSCGSHPLPHILDTVTFAAGQILLLCSFLYISFGFLSFYSCFFISYFY